MYGGKEVRDHGRESADERERLVRAETGGGGCVSCRCGATAESQDRPERGGRTRSRVRGMCAMRVCASRGVEGTELLSLPLWRRFSLCI